MTSKEPKDKSDKGSKSPSVSPRQTIISPKIMKKDEDKKENTQEASKKSPLPSPQEGIKKAKIGVTIKKSPNSDRTFESRLLDQDSEPSPTLKKKPLDAMAESETESVMSEDDGVRKEEMKKSIFMKRKSNDNSNSVSPRSPRSPRSAEEKKSPDRKSSNNYSNPFSFTHAKKATNDIIQNEILKNEIMKRKSEELNQKQKKSSEDKSVKSMSYSSSSESYSTSHSESSTDDEDTDYEIHEVYQLKEWFPPDLANKPDQADSMLTLIQSRSSTGLTIKEMRIEADPNEFK